LREALVHFLWGGRFPDAVAGLPDHFQPEQLSVETIFRALDLVPSPILVGMNPAATDIRTNAAGHALFGGADRNLSQSAVASERPDFAVYSDGKQVPPNELPMQRAALTGLPVHDHECELRFDDGTIKYINGKAVPVFGADGSVRGSIGVFFDITEKRDAARRDALALEEAKHRAKNFLSMVLAIGNLTLRSKLDRQVFKEFEQRLLVLGRSIDISASANGPLLTVADIISTTVANQPGTDMARIHLDGPVILTPERAVSSLGMAIHELVTNACKYGALSAGSGSVSITWAKIDGSNILAIDWSERGGPKVIPPSRKGFGSRLLTQVLGTPGGYRTKLTFNELGLECRLYLDLT
jgi:two-component sensor histidine kinase